MIRWQDINPSVHPDIDLSECTDITAPHNEKGERCPWPWGPQLLTEEPIGEYKCLWCGAPVRAGKEHPDYAPGPPIPTPAAP